MPDLDFIKVTGRFGLTVGDGPDPDETPDTIWCDEGQVRLVPLNTYTKVAGGAPKPWTAGHSVIDTTIDVNGYISWSGQPYVWMVDLTSDKVNPKVSPGKATHRVEFRNVRAGGVPVTFETQNVRLAADTVVDGVCDLTLLMPVPTGGGTPIVVGPQGPQGIQGPAGPGGSDEDVATYVATPGSDTEAAVAAKIETALADAEGTLGTQIVRHADNPNYPRPSTTASVLWIGSVEPVHASDTLGDIVALSTPYVPDTTPPTIPTGLAAESFDGSIVLTCNPSTDAVGVAQYKWYRGGTLIGTSAGTTFTDPTPVNGTTYAYTVSAIDAAGNASAQSAPLNATAQRTLVGVSGLKSLYVADDVPGVDLDPVSSWSPRAGSVATAMSVPSGSTTPKLHASALNGKKGVKFTKADANCLQVAGINATQPYTLFYVLDPTESAQNMRLLTVTTASTSILEIYFVGTALTVNSSVSNERITTPIQMGSGPVILAIVVDGASSKIYANKLSAQTGTLGSATGTPSLRLSRNAATSTAHASQEIFAIGVVSGAMPDADVQHNLKALARDFGLGMEP